jgi:mRNA interferase RelE/StbE
MQVVFLRRFSQDINKITQPKDRQALFDVIKLVKLATKLEDVSGIRKLRGFNNAFRIRSGNYRIGVFIEGKVVQFARVAHRKNIYKIFP